MGEVVAAVFTTHVPRLAITDPAARRAYMGRNVTTFYSAMEQAGRRLERLDFDSFVLFDSHWFTTLEYVLNAHRRLRGVYTSEELPAMLHDLKYDYRGDPALAEAIADSAHAGGMRALAANHRNLPLHYPALNVMRYFNPGARRRLLTIGVCQTASVKNDLDFGAAIGAALKKVARRVVLVASGGMSHKFWDYDRILKRASASPRDIFSAENRLFDQKIMRWFRAGDHARVLSSARRYRARCSPEGHFSHYLMMAGAMGAGRWTWRGIQYGKYEAAIGTGQSIFLFEPDGQGERR